MIILSIGVALLVTLQTFDVLKAVGKHHTMSAGLVIGGKDLRDEQRLINAMMILVKPGRRCTQTDDLASIYSTFASSAARGAAATTYSALPGCPEPVAGCRRPQ